MNDSTIYERHYPKVELAHAEDSEKQTEPLNFEQIMEKIHKDVVCVPLPEKQAAAKEFLNTAIELSNAYEIDVHICQHFDRIEVKYYFAYATSVGFLKDIVIQADDISIFKDTEGFNIVISLDYYTHATYRKDRWIIP